MTLLSFENTVLSEISQSWKDTESDAFSTEAVGSMVDARGWGRWRIGVSVDKYKVHLHEMMF